MSLTYAKNAAKKITEGLKNGEKHMEFLINSENTMKNFENNKTAFIKTIQNELEDIRIDSYCFERDVLILFYDKK